MGKKISMQNIADELGITKVSVSKALNNKVGVSNILREKIIRTAKQMGYVMSAVNSKKKYNLSFVVPKRFFLETDRFYNIIYYHLNTQALSLGHRITLVVIDEHEEKNSKIPNCLTQPLPDGIFMVAQMSESFLRNVCSLGIPTVALDFYQFGLDTDFVLADNFFLGYWAAMELIKKGHEKIGFVGDPLSTSSIADRYFGYVKGMTLANLSVDKCWLISNNDNKNHEYTADIKLPSDMPTAFICHCEMAAYFLKLTLENVGLSIPNDVSVIAFDDTDIGRTTMKELTTFNIGRHEIAETALKHMLEQLNSDDKVRGRHYVHSRLIERSSIKDLNSEK